LSGSSKNFPYYLHKLFCRISPALGETYLRWFSLVNFAIVFLIGEFFASIVEGMFPFPWLGKAFASVAEIFWLWIMTVGAFGHWWGFPVYRWWICHDIHVTMVYKLGCFSFCSGRCFSSSCRIGFL